jgi:hypothetical protein
MPRLMRLAATVVAGMLVRRYLRGRSVADRQAQPFVGGPTTELPPVPGGYGGMRPEDVAQ